MAGTETLRSDEPVSAGRTYAHAEPLALALDLLGDRWTFLVVRELLLGPQRFTDLSRTLPRMGRNLLATRLEQLTAARFVEVARLPWASGRGHPYALTARGQSLEGPLLALARCGLPDLTPDVGETRPGWAAFALAAASVTPPRQGSLDITIGGERFVIELRPGTHAQARRTATPAADAIGRAACTTRAALRLASRRVGPRTLLPVKELLGFG